MILVTPAVLALILGSVMSCLALGAAALLGRRISRNWDRTSGSSLQISLERKTYLVSTIVAYVMGYQALSLLLYVHTGESMHSLFVGAMCAAGTFNASVYGYPALYLKMANAVLCGLWLVLNHTDNKSEEYPLIRTKYRMLTPLAALVVLESVLQFKHFSSLSPNLITSCCGAIFSDEASSLSGSLAALPPSLAETLFYGGVLLHIRTGRVLVKQGRRAQLFGGLSLWLLIVTLVSVLSFISVYFYELPTHHCPFCLLQGEYGYIGYPLYIALLLGAITGIGVWLLEACRGKDSLSEIITVEQRRLAVASMIGFATVAIITLFPIIFSDFRLEGY